MKFLNTFSGLARVERRDVSCESAFDPVWRVRRHEGCDFPFRLFVPGADDGIGIVPDCVAECEGADGALWRQNELTISPSRARACLEITEF